MAIVALPPLLYALLGGAGAAAGVGGFLGYRHWTRLPPNCPYDVVVDIKSIARLPDGWTVEVKGDLPVGTQSQSKSDHPISEERNIVAVVGQFNHGKSWFLSQLSGENLPKGFMERTRGLSIKTSSHPSAKNFVLLDTEGTDSCVPYSELYGRRAVESFLRELTLELATIIVVVVNRLRRSDQIYIRSIVSHIAEYSRLTGTTKQLFLLHNLVECADETPMKQIIDEEIFQVFEAASASMQIVGHGDVEYWQSSMQSDTYDRKSVRIRHFVTAQDGTSAGKKYNAPTIALLRQLIDSDIEHRRSYNLLQEIVAFTERRLPCYIKLDQSSPLPRPTLDLQKGKITVQRASTSPEAEAPVDQEIIAAQAVQQDSSSSSSSAASSSSDETQPPSEQFELLPELTFDAAGCLSNTMFPLSGIRPAYNVVDHPDWYDFHVDVAGAEVRSSERSPHTISIKATREIPEEFEVPECASYLRRDIFFGDLSLNEQLLARLDLRAAVVKKEKGNLLFYRFMKEKSASVPF